jgi:hypothetical protein
MSQPTLLHLEHHRTTQTTDHGIDEAGPPSVRGQTSQQTAQTGTARYDSSAGVVTTLSQLGANRGSQPETARDGFCWSEDFETHCTTTKFTRCPTGGQVVAGPTPVRLSAIRSD